MSTSMRIPLDSDGFLRRECPNCEREFKWHINDDDSGSEPVDQYYCPLCGRPSGLDQWFTRAQLEHAQARVMPEAMDMVRDALDDAFKKSFRGSKSVSYKPGKRDYSDLPTPAALHEPDDMMIVEPPCHPDEPVKVPELSSSAYHCLICGEAFAA